MIGDMLADIANYETRIQCGKVREASIIIALRGVGLAVEASTPEQDKHQKIDGWLTDRFGERHPLQIKFRENGPDIIFEIIKDFNLDIPGRDMICRAEYYFVVDPKNHGRLFLTAPIKRFAQKVMEIVLEDISVKPDKTCWKGKNGWEAKLTIDRAHGNQKLMGYFSPQLFTSIADIYCPR